MASFVKPGSGRRLQELLEVQQEPFLLDVYLLEKGYSAKCWNSEATIWCWSGGSFQSLKRSSSYGCKNTIVARQRCSRILRSILTKLAYGKNRKTSNCAYKAAVDGRFSVSDMGVETQGSELDRFSSVSSTTVFDSCSGGSREESPSIQKSPISFSPTEKFRGLKPSNMKEKAETDRRLQYGCMEDNKQLSPVSVLELNSNEGSPLYKQMKFCRRICKEENSSTTRCLFKEFTDKTILSASPWEYLLLSLKEKLGIEVTDPQQLLQCGSSSQYQKTKRMMQQTKQLLSDCVREVVENHEIKGGRGRIDQYLATDIIEKTICDRICSWEKQGGNVTNINHLLESVFLESVQEWCHVQPQMKQIGVEIGDAIFEEMRDGIVLDMLDFSANQR